MSREEIFCGHVQWAHHPHSPPHLFISEAHYIITARTHRRELIFNSGPKLDQLQEIIFEQAQRFEWRLEAWSIFPNHYHLILQSPANPETLSALIRAIHSKSAVYVNKQDSTPGRQVWYQYRDTCLLTEVEYYTRLQYVLENPVRHRVIGNARDYPWCSFRWFELNAAKSFVQTVASFKTDTIDVDNDFADAGFSAEDLGLPKLF